MKESRFNRFWSRNRKSTTTYQVFPVFQTSSQVLQLAGAHKSITSLRSHSSLQPLKEDQYYSGKEKQPDQLKLDKSRLKSVATKIDFEADEVNNPFQTLGGQISRSVPQVQPKKNAIQKITSSNDLSRFTKWVTKYSMQYSQAQRDGDFEKQAALKNKIAGLVPKGFPAGSFNELAIGHKEIRANDKTRIKISDVQNAPSFQLYKKVWDKIIESEI